MSCDNSGNVGQRCCAGFHAWTGTGSCHAFPICNGGEAQEEDQQNNNHVISCCRGFAGLHFRPNSWKCRCRYLFLGSIDVPYSLFPPSLTDWFWYHGTNPSQTAQIYTKAGSIYYNISSYKCIYTYGNVRFSTEYKSPPMYVDFQLYRF